jgi:hypothetical protein
MAWSIFQQGGGQGAAVTWAEDLEKALGVPQTPANNQFIYDWEVSEGGGGAYNPLNQGPDPSNPSLSGGSQYGGGASDYNGWQAGITGAVDYLNMPAYAEVKRALQQSNYTNARSALIASSWAASHYNNGSSFSSAAVPGASNLASGGGSMSGSGSGSQNAQTTSAACQWYNPTTYPGCAANGTASAFVGVLSVFGITPTSIGDMLERAGLMIFGLVVILFGVKTFVSSSTVKKDLNKAANGEYQESGRGEGLASEETDEAEELGRKAASRAPSEATSSKAINPAILEAAA